MKKLIAQVAKYATLYRDDKSGLAWIEDGSTGTIVTVHPNIDASGSVSGMKRLGYWGRYDRTIRKNGFIYNIDRYVCNEEDRFERIVSFYCQCDGCSGRR